MSITVYGIGSKTRSVINDQFVAYEQYTRVKGNTVKIRSVAAGIMKHNPIQAPRTLAEMCQEDGLVSWKLYDEGHKTLIYDWRCKVLRVSSEWKNGYEYQVITLQRLK